MSLFDFFKKPHPDLTLPKTREEIWFRDTYAIWSQGNFDSFQHFCGLENNESNSTECRFLLERDWEITNKKLLLQTFSSLTGTYDDTNIVIEDMKLLKNSIDKENRETYEFLRNSLAWDLCRSTQILGMGYHANMITREMMNANSLVAGRLMQEIFTSWDDMVSCYLDGYSSWARGTFDTRTAEENIEIRNQSYQVVKNHSKPAYKIEWNLKF